MKVSTILDQIDSGIIALPEFQRGYVWNRDQVRGLMQSLYRKHPVGSLLVWVTQTETANTRGDGVLAVGSVELLLDGQQRITTLYGIIRSRPPRFFDGNAQAFTGLYFHLEDEIFEFYAPLKMRDNPLWISVSDLLHDQTGFGKALDRVYENPELSTATSKYAGRVMAIAQIRDIDLHIEKITGEDKTVDVVVDIFNRVNSGGTKLSKGDLALARICAGWPEAREEMKMRLTKWHQAGFEFGLDWLLRCINAVVTGEALFVALKDVNTLQFRDGLEQAERAADKFLNLVASRLGLDHDRVLGSRSAIPLIVRYIVQHNGDLGTHQERNKLLYWYIHAFLWGRYAGSTESVLNQDLSLIEKNEGALDRLIAQLYQNRGDLRLYARDFTGSSKSARFYPLLYMLTRVCRAVDLDTGVELSNHLLGHLSHLEVHHIFPKALLNQHGYSKDEVNAIANFTFLTQETNLKVSDRTPQEYLETFAQRHPGAIESHWIPTDRALWMVENYPSFLTARRELLAQAANRFLESLLISSAGDLPAIESAYMPIYVQSVTTGDDDRIVREINEWIIQSGLPAGEYLYELADPVTGVPLTLLDLAWPSGIQEGYSQPVALLIAFADDSADVATGLGYRCFTDAIQFRTYVSREILALEPVTA